MSKDLLRLAYISLIRSQLEFSCAIFSSASVTQLQKLDIIQKMSSRVVCSAPRDAHAAPLLQALKLENLGDRRKAHIEKIIKSILSNSCHPALCNLFTQLDDGRIVNDEKSRIKFSATVEGSASLGVISSTQNNELSFKESMLLTLSDHIHVQ